MRRGEDEAEHGNPETPHPIMTSFSTEKIKNNGELELYFIGRQAFRRIMEHYNKEKYRQALFSNPVEIQLHAIDLLTQTRNCLPSG